MFLTRSWSLPACAIKISYPCWVRSLFMPQVGLKRNEYLDNFLLPSFVHCKNYSYPANLELLYYKYACYPTFERQKNDIPNLKDARKMIYQTYFSSTQPEA